MTKKIKAPHDCKKYLVPRGSVLLGIRKKEGLLAIPGQPQAELIPGAIMQCTVCKTVYVVEIRPKDKVIENPILVAGK